MQTILIFLLVIIAIAIVALVLIQHGKGADIGASFGSGASNSIFGSQGSTSFLMKLTGVLVALFFIICIVLTNMATRAGRQVVLPTTQNIPVQQSAPTSVPVAPTK